MDFATLIAGFGAFLSGVQSIFNFSSNIAADALDEERYNLSLELQGLDINSKIAQVGLSEKEATSQISLYEQWLGSFDSSAQLERDTFAQQGKKELDSLLSNYGQVNEIAGATGRTQGKLLHQGKDIHQQAVGFAGEDLALGGEGAAAGLHERGLTELNTGLALQKTTAESQLGVYRETLATLATTKTNLEAALAAIDAARNKTTTTQGDGGGGGGGDGGTGGGDGGDSGSGTEETIYTETYTPEGGEGDYFGDGTAETTGSNQGSTLLDPGAYEGDLAGFLAAGGQATDWYSIWGYHPDSGSSGGTTQEDWSTQLTDGSNQGSTTLDPSEFGTVAEFEAAGGQATDWYSVHGYDSGENTALTEVEQNIQDTGTTAPYQPPPPNVTDYDGQYDSWIAAGGNPTEWLTYWAVNAADSVPDPVAAPETTVADITEEESSPDPVAATETTVADITEGESSYETSDLMSLLGLVG